ncbi:MAG: hypothetical protein Q9170_003948 [Blastenia crenularia]
MSSILDSVFSTLKGAGLIALCSVVGVRLLSSFITPGTAAVIANPPPPAVVRPVIPVNVYRDRPLRKKKSVRFDLVRNTLHTYSPVICKFKVTFANTKNWVEYWHEEDPAGYDTLHCQKTKFIRDWPSNVEVIDDDGDVGMGGF